MKKNIHPDYYENIEITCACGNKTVAGSTMKGPIRIEICSHCHPFWTGEKKLIDTEGRVEKFERQRVQAQNHQEKLVNKKVSKKDKSSEKKPRALTLRELLQESR